eukprot:10937351-Prorocentrum_lima.AAC.1
MEAAYSKAELLKARAQTPCGKDHKEGSALQTILAQQPTGRARTPVGSELSPTMDTPCIANPQTTALSCLLYTSDAADDM